MNDLSLEDAWRAAVHKRLIKEHHLNYTIPRPIAKSSNSYIDY